MNHEQPSQEGIDSQDEERVRDLESENARLRHKLGQTEAGGSASAESSDENREPEPFAAIVAQIDRAVRRNPVGGVVAAFGIGLIAARVLRGGP